MQCLELAFPELALLPYPPVPLTPQGCAPGHCPWPHQARARRVADQPAHAGGCEWDDAPSMTHPLPQPSHCRRFTAPTHTWAKLVQVLSFSINECRSLFAHDAMLVPLCNANAAPFPCITPCFFRSATSRPSATSPALPAPYAASITGKHHSAPALCLHCLPSPPALFSRSSLTPPTHTPPRLLFQQYHGASLPAATGAWG